MNEELQLKLAREIWGKTKGSLNASIYFIKSSSEEALALEELLRRGVIIKN